MLKNIFKFLASLKLALVLLAIIILASIVGTFYETSFNAEVARKYIYNAWWFNEWLGLLVINLFCAAAVRYPWKPHQTGFVITHAGIITLLIGGMIDRTCGIEGYIELVRGEAPTKIMQLHEEQLGVYVDGKSASTDFNIKSMTSMDDIHVNVNSPSPDVQVKAVDIYPPAVHLVLNGPTMGHQEQWLFYGDNVNMGPASMRFIGAKRAKRAERHFVFAKYDSPIVKTIGGEPTGAVAHLVIKEENKEPELQLSMQGKDFNFPVKPNVKKSLPLEGLDGWTISIMGYYPDFKITSQGVTSASDEPNNPTITFALDGPEVISGDAPEQNDEEDAHSGKGYSPPRANAMSLYLDDDGKLYYYVRSRKLGESRGEVKIGEHVPLGWAGADFSVERFVSEGLSRVMSHEDINLPDSVTENMKPGLLCQVSAKGQSKQVWVPHNRLNVRHLPHPGPDGKDYKIEVSREAVEVGGQRIELALASKYVELPFTVCLKKFSAPRQEGMESSMNFAAFESVLSFNDQEDTVQLKPGYKVDPEFSDFVVEGAEPNAGPVLQGAITDATDTTLNMAFTDPQTRVLKNLTLNLSDVVKQEKRTRKISMNRPTTFPPSTFGPYLGTDFKFSQAGHDMEHNPDYSSVQVLRDPGWLLKWVGCLGICLGIFTMFYLKPYFKRAPAAIAAASESDVAEKSTKLASAAASDLKKKVRKTVTAVK